MASVTAKLTCAQCHTEYEVGPNFCSHCGKPLKDPPPPVTPRPAVKPKTRKVSLEKGPPPTAPKRTPSKNDKDALRPPLKGPTPPKPPPKKPLATRAKTRPISEVDGPVSDLNPPQDRLRSDSMPDAAPPPVPDQISSVRQRLAQLGHVQEEPDKKEDPWTGRKERPPNLTIPVGSPQVPAPPVSPRSPRPRLNRPISENVGTGMPDLAPPQKPRAPSLPDREPPPPPTSQDGQRLRKISESRQEKAPPPITPKRILSKSRFDAPKPTPPLPPPKKKSSEKPPNIANLSASTTQDAHGNKEEDVTRGTESDSPRGKREPPATPKRSSSINSDTSIVITIRSERQNDDTESVASFDPDVEVEDPLLIGYRNEVKEHRKQSIMNTEDQNHLPAPSFGGLQRPRKKSVPYLDIQANGAVMNNNGHPAKPKLLTRAQASIYKRRPMLNKLKSVDRDGDQVFCSRCVLSLGAGEIHVHFVTIVNPEFQFNEDSDRMFVRMGGTEFGSMVDNTLEMRQSRSLKDKFVLFEGSKVFKANQVLDKMLPYMYLIEKSDGETQWEALHKDGKDDGWNRCLHIHSAKYNGTGVWTQYDWPVQMAGEKKEKKRESKIIMKRASQLGKKHNQDRQIAVETYLPNWEGFRQMIDPRKEGVIGQTSAETMEVSKALDQAEQVWNCLTECQLKDITTGSTTSWDSPGFDLQKTVIKLLSDKINSYKSKATPDINNDQLHSALAICYLVDHHALPISDSELNKLWDGLLLSPCSEDISVTVLQSLRRQFGPYLKFAIRSLESQCNIAIQKSWKTGEHRWLLAAPLLHFLRGDIRPFSAVEIDPEADYTDPNCWGLSGLNANKGWVLRADSGSLSQIHKRIDMLCHSVEQDRLIPYVILWLLITSKDQRRILVDFHEHLPKRHKTHPYLLLHALDTVMQKLATYQLEPKSPAKHSSWDNKYLTSDVGLLCNSMVSFLKANRFIASSIGEKFINMSVSVAQSALALASIKHQELVTRSFTLINLCIASLEQGQSADGIYLRIRLPIVELVEWLRQNLPAKFMDYNVKDKKPSSPVEIGIWKELFKMTFPRVFDDVWKRTLLELFKERLYNTIPDAARVRIAQISTGRPELDHVIHHAAVESMEKMLKSEKKTKKDELRSSQYEKVGDLMSELLKTSILPKSREQNEEEKWQSLQKILDWKPIVTLITVAGADSSTNLDSEASLGLSFVTCLVEEMSEKLLDGTIQLRQLYTIVGDGDKLQRFLDIYKTPSVNKQYNFGSEDGNSKLTKVSPSNMETLLKIRQKEFQSIEEKQPLTENFVQMCQSLAPGIQVETTQLVNKAVFDVKTSENTLMQHCTTFTHRRKSITSSNDISKYQPVVKIVVPAAVMAVLQPLYNCSKKDSQIFRAICKNQIDLVTLKIEQRVVSTVYAAMEIWRPIINKWERIKAGLPDGSLTVEDVYSYFAGLAGSEVALREALCKFSDKEERLPKWLGDRVAQIQDLFQSQSSIEFSCILTDLIDVLELSQTRISDLGNWTELATSGSRSLKSITVANKISKVAKQLSTIDSTQVESIKQVVQSERVVKWIRNNVQDVSEFFEFIEEVQCTELETDAQFDALSAFSRAVDGYAPVIFGLKEAASLDDVIQACHVVWTNLQYDRNMASVLRDSQKYLPMLQQFREDKGYAQTTAMQEVEAINARGTYTIGTQPGEGSDYYCEPNLDLFQLLVSKDNNNPDSRATTYKLDDLQELEKSLTLMSSNVTAKPEKQGQLDYFTEVLTLVQQTAAVYKTLCSSGCMFFKEWGAKLHCFHYHSKPSMVAHFGTGKAISGSREITKELVDLRLFMEECIRQWLDYVDKIRSKYYHLNGFTNDQLMLLRQNLAQRDILGDLPHTFALLSKVKRDCNKEHLDIALSKCETGRARNEPSTSIMLNQALAQQARHPSSLRETFRTLWQVYLQNIIESDLGKALSLESMGRLLQELDKQEQRVKRRPFTFKEGQPNIIQCESEDLLVNILSVYEGDRLPSSDEVLVCNTETTSEQVCLLFRRAFDDPNGRIFCLGGPEVLEARVSNEVLMYFNSTNDRQASQYRLVVVHGTKRTSSPLLDAFAKYKGVPAPKQGLRPKIKQYLEQQFKLAKGTLSSQCPVHVLSSTKPGTGKSLEVTDRAKRLQAILIDNGSPGIQLNDILLSLPIQGDEVDIRAVLSAIWNHINVCHFAAKPHVFHFDISPSVRTGLDVFLFQLLITGEITDSKGIIWRRRPEDLYIVEATDLPINPKGSISKNRRFFNLLPCSTCYTPKEVYWQLDANRQQQRKSVANPETFESAIRFTLESPEIKYVARHLWMLDSNMDLEDYSYEADTAPVQEKAHGKALEIVKSLLKYCGCEDPSWRSLQQFAKFMTMQLRKCETSGLYQVRNLKGVGFKKFVVQFMAKMAREFTMPSLKLLEGTQEADRSVSNDSGPLYQLLRAWNTSSHPYIYFLKEGEGSVAFYGCTFDPEGSLIDSATKKVLEASMVSTDLMHGLKWNGTNFDGKDDVNLKELCKVLGIRYTFNPDESFKLTADNVKKLLGIHTRLRYGLPVVLMGDRGCGKTRLIRYLCRLQAMDSPAKNLIHVKVHGGTTANDIMHCLTRAEIQQTLNRETHHVDTIMYIDEANSSEAFDLVKEIVCDGRARGHPIALAELSLKIIVSCNPYRRYAPAFVERLKSAGLGFNKFVHQRRQNQGPIPFGEMVYNVRPIPPSMLDFVWDYGDMGSKHDRDICILQVVIARVESGKLRVNAEEAAVIGLIICTSQTYLMKRQHDECGLVSMKDVNRLLDVLIWFVDKMTAIEAAIQRLLKSTSKTLPPEQSLTPITKALSLAVAVCYYARLHDNRQAYLEEISGYFKGPCSFTGGSLRLEQEISLCQNAFMNELHLPSNIACNAALKENVFMMIVCIELRIPLFLIGKPGTSKSLAKTIVADAMDGSTSGSGLFKALKRAQFTSYQCNPKTTRKDINGVFEEASVVADTAGPESFVSVVCLDEIGLAEGSKDTPLKILQPYLEIVPEEEEEEMYPPRTSCKNISFIAMSNWAVDVANMNTGIFIIIDDPDLEILLDTAKELCPSTDIFMKLGEKSSLLPALAKAFLFILAAQKNEYFGYPDFYNLIKMIIAFCQKTGRIPTMSEIEHCVRRNFDRCGSDSQWNVFREELKKYEVDLWTDSTSEDPYCTDVGLVRANIEMSPNNIMQGETRHMLIETENYAAISLLQDHVLKDEDPIVFYGSSFRLDQTYSQVCRSVNRIKRCMENGRTVILVNHADLFECIHDVLNLHHVSFAGQNYAELALGTNRVKCRIHRDFRLIVVENREIVHNCFSSPLLGRFEKHYLAASTMLNEKEKFIANRLSSWLLNFAADVRGERRSTVDVQDIVVGYHPDAIPSLVHKECQLTPINGDDGKADVIFDNVQSALIECATSAAQASVRGVTPRGYTSLENFMWTRLQCSKLINDHGDLAQITTHSGILTDTQLTQLEETLHVERGCIQPVKDLEEYESERQFRAELRKFFSASRPAAHLYQIFYCRDGHKKRDLIACASHFIQDERSVARIKDSKTHVIFLIHIPQGNTNFRGFLGGEWISAHIPSLTLSSPRVIQPITTKRPPPPMPPTTKTKPTFGLRPPGSPRPPPVSQRPLKKTSVSDESPPYGTFTQPEDNDTFM